MKLTRILALTLAILTVLAFAACNDSSKNNDDTPDVPNQDDTNPDDNPNTNPDTVCA